MKTIAAEVVLEDFEGFLAELNHDHQPVVVEGGDKTVVMMSQSRWEEMHQILNS